MPGCFELTHLLTFVSWCIKSYMYSWLLQVGMLYFLWTLSQCIKYTLVHFRLTLSQRACLFYLVHASVCVPCCCKCLHSSWSQCNNVLRYIFSVAWSQHAFLLCWFNAFILNHLWDTVTIIYLPLKYQHTCKLVKAPHQSWFVMGGKGLVVIDISCLL